MKNDPQRRSLSHEDQKAIEAEFRRLGGSASVSCIPLLEKRGAVPINKDALAETAGGITGSLKHLFK